MSADQTTTTPADAGESQCTSSPVILAERQDDRGKTIRAAFEWIERERNLGASRHEGWEVLGHPHPDPTVEACRQLLSFCARNCSGEFFWDRMIDEGDDWTATLDEAVRLAQCARKIVEPLVVAAHGSCNLKLGSVTVGSAWQAIDLIANRLIRSAAGFTPKVADQEGACFTPTMTVEDDDTYLAIYVACCESASCASGISSPKRTGKKAQSDKAPLWRDANGNDVLSPLAEGIALVVGEGEGKRIPLKSYRDVVDAIVGMKKEGADCWARLPHPTYETVKAMGSAMKNAELLAGTKQGQPLVLTDKSREMIPASRQPTDWTESESRAS